MAKGKQISDEILEGTLKNGSEQPLDTNTGDADTSGETLSNEDSAIKAARIAKEVTTTTSAKDVKFQVVEPVDCIIAGIPYKLNKDKSYNVPSDVAAILVNAKKGYRI